MVEAGDWAVELPSPLLLHDGKHVWVQGATVWARNRSGDVVCYPGDGYWLCR
ncbi:hypothetical protein GCM10007977_083830 [Dactylosporangium sucinum]|uniref:Uncharacterized protein n=1 Tax=Dactylosporangium sucinum TaxID=1424081 RepID=A0A917U9R8_9ACTN|nr:hypothetical protein GCM10007977_083830 [Dactylosporangium sucinum]